MLCHHCGNEMPLGQRVCAACGQSDDLTPPGGGPATFTIVEQTQVVVPVRDAWVVPAPPAPPAASAPSASLPISRVAVVPAHEEAPARLIPRHEPEPEPRTTLLGVLAGTAGLTTIAAAMVQILTIRSDAPIAQYLGEYTISDLDGVGTNFQTGWIIAGCLMLIGGLLVVQRRAERFGAGLAGGAGAIIVPLAAFAATGTWSLTDRARQQAQYVSASGGGGTEFASTLTAGFFVLLAAAALGIASAFVAIGFARGDRRRPLSTVLCVMGAVGCVVAGAGQLMPENGASFGDNFSNPYSVGAFVYSRLAMIAMMVVLGVLGFLLASRFGLGLALGAVSVYAWQWGSSQFDVGNLPLPPAIFNPGGDGGPHLFTTIGVITALVCAAGVAADASRSAMT